MDQSFIYLSILYNIPWACHLFTSSIRTIHKGPVIYLLLYFIHCIFDHSSSHLFTSTIRTIYNGHVIYDHMLISLLLFIFDRSYMTIYNYITYLTIHISVLSKFSIGNKSVVNKLENSRVGACISNS